MQDLPTYLLVLMTVPPLLVAVILHEVAHGYVAERLGDPTARRLGRITLNPIKHIDFFMTILVPGVLILSGSPIIFGGAKPVPVNPGYFSDPRRGMVYVALAGPVTNFILATLCYLVLIIPNLSQVLESTPLGIGVIVQYWFVYGILINLVLGLFNLLPIPPLDGGRVAVGLLPLKLARPLARVEPYGIFIVVALLFLGLLDFVLRPAVHFVLEHLFQ